MSWFDEVGKNYIKSSCNQFVGETVEGCNSAGGLGSILGSAKLDTMPPPLRCFFGAVLSRR